MEHEPGVWLIQGLISFEFEIFNPNADKEGKSLR